MTKKEGMKYYIERKVEGKKFRLTIRHYLMSAYILGKSGAGEYWYILLGTIKDGDFASWPVGKGEHKGGLFFWDVWSILKWLRKWEADELTFPARILIIKMRWHFVIDRISNLFRHI